MRSLALTVDGLHSWSTNANPISFSKNTHPDIVSSICSILQMIQMGLTTKYLGLPLHLGKSRKKSFEEVKDRVSKKTSGV